MICVSCSSFVERSMKSASLLSIVCMFCDSSVENLGLLITLEYSDYMLNMELDWMIDYSRLANYFILLKIKLKMNSESRNSPKTY